MEGGKLKATERWKMNGQSTEVVNKFNYKQAMFESIGGWNKHKTLAQSKGYHAPIATDKCISVTSNKRVEFLQKTQCDS
jgi:hypothetical protein